MTGFPREKTGLIVVDHGSRRHEANRMLEEVVELMRRESQDRYAVIEPAHMELADPTIETALKRCVEQGATRVAVTLFFLSPGRHSTSDIPRMAREAAAHYPGLQVVVTSPIGVDQRVAEILFERSEEALTAASAREQSQSG